DRRPRSLSALGPEEAEEGFGLPAHEEGFMGAEARALLGRIAPHLPARERIILHLRFRKDLHQHEIAALLGISQMHVSRLLARAMETLAGAEDGTSRSAARR